MIPVSAGIYFRGGGIGPAFIFLWVSPASNILALIYTDAIIGYDMALARVIVAFLMSVVVGLFMTWVFIKEERERIKQSPVFSETDPEGEKISIIKKKDIVLLILIVATLLAPNYLVVKGPYWKKVVVFFVFLAITFGYAFWTKTKEEIKNG